MNVKLSLCSMKKHTMKAYGVEELQLYVSFSSVHEHTAYEAKFSPSPKRRRRRGGKEKILPLHGIEPLWPNHYT